MAGRIRQDDIDAVKERTDLAKLIGQYLTLKKSGHDSLTGLCPFHQEKSPSFSVSPAQRWLVVRVDAKQMWLAGNQQFLGVSQFFLIIRIEGVAKGLERIANGGELIVMHHHTSRQRTLRQLPELFPCGWILRDVFGVHDKARGAPIFGHRIGLAVNHTFCRKALLLCGGIVVWQTLEIEFLDQPQFLICGNGIVRWHEEVPTRRSCLQFGQHFFV